MSPDGILELRVADLERSLRRVRALACGAVVCCAAIGIAALSSSARTATAAPAVRFQTLDSIRVRALIVVDSGGRERARVAAPLPDPIILGRRVSRGGGVSGFLISDAEGNERGGYVTDDRYPNAFFTLDDMISQKVLFVVEPQGATTLRLRHGGSFVQTSVGENGPALRMERNGVVVFSQPPDSGRR